MAEVRRCTPAIEDLVEQYAYIAADSPASADRFLAALEVAFEQLAEMPGLGRRRELGNPRLADVRQWPVSGFERYLIFYRPIEGGIEVLRVLHSARDIEEILETE